MNDTPLWCPKCKGVSGYEYDMTETHRMGAGWGEGSSAGDSGRNIKQSLVECIDCGHKFQWKSLIQKGLVS